MTPPASSPPTPSVRVGPSPDHLNVVFVGHVDHGKSTLIGRLLIDTDSVPEGKIEQVRAACDAEGTEFEPAFLLDALLEEQAQNVTMDTTRVPFRTDRRSFTIIDAPGHVEFLKHMISGAASADAAVLIIDAQHGVREQTRRHGYMLAMLGIRQVLVAINKMDLIEYDGARFASLRREINDLVQQIGLRTVGVVPVSAKRGEGLIRRSTLMPWYHDSALLDALEAFPHRNDHGREALLRLVVQDVYRFDQRRLVVGFLECGQLQVGDTVEFHPGKKRTRVKTIETWPGTRADAPVPDTEPWIPDAVVMTLPEAGAAPSDGRPIGKLDHDAGFHAGTRNGGGRSIAITLEDELFIERGHWASGLNQSPNEAREFVARVFWLHHEPLRVGDTLPLRLATQQVEVRIVAVPRVLDAVTLQSSLAPANAVQRHEVAEIRVRARRPLRFELSSTIPELSRFVLLRRGRIAGGGVIDSAVGESGPKDGLPITPAARESLLGHRGAVIWLTGLSGAGKSTLATALERRLLRAGVLPVILDGDVLRAGLCQGLGFGEADRKENIRRAAEAALLIAESGAVVITALISPYRADRQLAAERCHARGVPFAEVFVNAPLAECERRDPKHLYRRARAGEIPAFTGISSPYEPPLAPALELPTDRESVDQSVEKLAALAMELARPENRDVSSSGAEI